MALEAEEEEDSQEDASDFGESAVGGHYLESVERLVRWLLQSSSSRSYCGTCSLRSFHHFY